MGLIRLLFSVDLMDKSFVVFVSNQSKYLYTLKHQSQQSNTWCNYDPAQTAQSESLTLAKAAAA